MLLSYFVGQKEDVAVSYVTENETKVNVPDRVPLSIYKSDMWREYDARCIGCGRQYSVFCRPEQL